MSNFKFQMAKAGRWALAAAWMGVIFAFSSRPGYSLPEYGVWDIIVKKGAHATEYAILGWLIQRALGVERPWWQAWLAAVLYAATDELHQSLVPSRYARVTDVVIDAAGAMIGVTLYALRSTTLPRLLPARHRRR